MLSVSLGMTKTDRKSGLNSDLCEKIPVTRQDGRQQIFFFVNLK